MCVYLLTSTRLLRYPSSMYGSLEYDDKPVILATFSTTFEQLFPFFTYFNLLLI